MTVRVSDRAVLEVIEHIYSASCDPAEWPAVTQRCERLFPGVAFSLFISRGDQLDPLSSLSGWDPDYVRSYAEHYHTLNCYQDLLRALRPGRVVRASQIVPMDWLQQQVFYQEWLRPQGNRIYGAQVTLAREAGAMTRITYDLPERLADVEGPAAAMLDRIGPHFRRALDATSCLQKAKVSQAVLQAMIEQIAAAALVIDRSRRVLYANRRAIALLEGRSIVRERPASGLAFVSHAAQDAFQRALSTGFDTAENAAATSFMVHVSNGEAHPVRILPLRLSRLITDTTVGSRLALVLIGSDCAKPSHAALEALYGLSRAEANVALCIADGGTLKTAAANLGVAPSTARNQLAAAMAKLDVHRQAELVSRLAGLTPRVNFDSRAQ